MALVVVEIPINGMPFTFQVEEQEARERGLLKEPPKVDQKKTGKQ